MNEKKIVLFLHDGVIEGGFTTDSSARVTICDFDRELDDQEAENAFWKECENKGMELFAPDIYHPGAKDTEGKIK